MYDATFYKSGKKSADTFVARADRVRQPECKGNGWERNPSGRGCRRKKVTKKMKKARNKKIATIALSGLGFAAIGGSVAFDINQTRKEKKRWEARAKQWHQAQDERSKAWETEREEVNRASEEWYKRYQEWAKNEQKRRAQQWNQYSQSRNRQTEGDRRSQSQQPNSSLKSQYAKILGVDSKASQLDIRKAYIKLAQQYHPDVAGSNNKEAEEKMKEINNAFDFFKEQFSRRGDSMLQRFDAIKDLLVEIEMGLAA